MRPRPITGGRPPVRLGRVAPFTLLALLTLFGCAPTRRVHARAAEEVRRGYVHLEAGDPERAGVAFEHALAFNPEFAEALNGAAIVARRAGRNREARELLERALIAREDFAEAQVNMGELELGESHPDAAEARFRKALSIDPDLLPARLDLARSLLHRGRMASAPQRERLWSEARREYLHLLESSPGLADAHHDLAYIDHEEGRFERAAAEYAAAIRADPSHADARLGACVSLARAGRWADAAAACRGCLEIAAGDARCASSLRSIEASAQAR